MRGRMEGRRVGKEEKALLAVSWPSGERIPFSGDSWGTILGRDWGDGHGEAVMVMVRVRMDWDQVQTLRWGDSSSVYKAERRIAEI